MTRDWNDDDVLLDELRSAMVLPPVPQRVIEAGYAAFAWRTIDAELASLTFDSAAADPLLAGTRASHTAHLRVMTFTSNTMTIEIEVTDGALLGQIVPPNASSVTIVERSGKTQSAPVDPLGCFTVAPIPAQPFRIRVECEGPTSTTWITL